MSGRTIFLFVSLITMASLAAAQQQSFVRDTSFMVNAGAKLNDVIPSNHLFHYHSFLPGKVFFRDGKVSEARMNYNRLMDEMHFIGKSGDTLAVADEATIRLICIEKDSFYFDRVYVMLVKDLGAVKLGVKHGFKTGDRRKHTGYDVMSSTSSVSSLSSLHDDRRIHQLEVKEQTTVFKVTQYYFGDKYNRFVPATEKNLADLFPECAQSIKEFCKKNGIDFNHSEHLEKVIVFLASACQ